METVHEGDDRQAGRCLFGQDVWLYIAQRLSLSERELEITQGVFDDKQSDCPRIGLSSHRTRISERLITSCGWRLSRTPSSASQSVISSSPGTQQPGTSHLPPHARDRPLQPTAE
jgi:hypothetical protein